MICCILALLLAGPLGVVLAPIWAARLNAGGENASCCTPKYVLLRSAAVVIGVLLFSALVAVGLHFLDPPAFRRFCTFHVFR